MKNIFRVIGFGAAVIAFSAVTGYAQADPCEDSYETKTAAYEKYRTNVGAPRTAAKFKVALEAGKDFIAKYGKCDDTKEVADTLTQRLPAVQKEYERLDRIERFNTSVPAKNWAEAFKAGKEIIAADPNSPDSLDVALVLASIGFDRAAIDKVDTFNNDTIAMAETAIRLIESGVKSTTYGALGFFYEVKENKTTGQKALPGEQNALGWMNYTIGFIKYVRQKNMKDSLPYLYKAATKYNSATKEFPATYEMIGFYYKEELLRIDNQRQEKIKANGNKDNDETLAMWELERGYIERAIDAYARAHKIVAEKAKTPQDNENKNRIYNEIKVLYESSFKKTDGVDAYIASLISKPFVDPMTTVQPVKEEVPTTTTTTTSPTTPNSNVTTTTTTTTAKPTTTTTNTTTTTKPASTTTNSTTTTKPTSTTKPKTTVKKKSSR